MGKPSTKSLISGVSHLSKLRFPYSENYPYYKLADRLQVSLETILSQVDIPTTSKEKIQIGEKRLPRDVKSYLRHKNGEVDQTACQNLLDLLYELMEYTAKGNAPYRQLDQTVIEDLKATHKYVGDAEQEKVPPKLIQWRVVRDFWLRARSCTKLAGSIPKEHTGLKLLDLISACGGYRNFADFLHLEFGDGYDPEKDAALQALLASGVKHAGTASEKQKKGRSLKGTLTSYFKQAEEKFRSKSKNVGKLTNILAISLLLLLGCIVAYLLTGRAKEAHINVALTTRYLYFQTAQMTTLRSADKFILASGDHFSIRNAVYTLDYPFSDTLPAPIKVKPLGQELVGIEHIKLPKDAKSVLESPTKKDMYVSFSESEGLNGFIPVNHAILFSPQETDSVAYDHTPIGTGVNFQSEESQRIEISLINAEDFEWPPLYVTSVGFGELKQDGIEYGIESAQIYFSTGNEPIHLNPRDLLSITFENPIKLLVNYQEGMISLRFTGVVNNLYAGPEIFGKNNSNNKMPKRWEEYGGLSSVMIIAIVMMAFFLVMYIPGVKRAT